MVDEWTREEQCARANNDRYSRRASGGSGGSGGRGARVVVLGSRLPSSFLSQAQDRRLLLLLRPPPSFLLVRPLRFPPSALGLLF